MLTLKLISEETERVVKGLEKKHFNGAREAIEKVLELDKQRRDAQQKLDVNKQQQNQLSKQIGALMKSGKKDEASDIKQKVAELKQIMPQHEVVMAVGAIWQENCKAGIDRLLSEADRLMYDDKAAYYSASRDLDRRKS